MDSVLVNKNTVTSKNSPRGLAGEFDLSNYMMIQSSLPNVVTASHTPKQYFCQTKVKHVYPK